MVRILVLVSVVMPSYNHEKYISESIESVLNQSFKDFELIIVDDCSKDNSQDIITAYQRKDARIRALFHKKNMGIAKTANDLLAEAKGKYVAFTSSDDVWEKSKLEKQLLILDRNDSLIVWSEGEIIDSDSKPKGYTFASMHGAEEKKKSGDIFSELLFGNFVFGSSLIFKRTLIRNIFFNEELKYYNDFLFVLDLAKKYNFYFIPEALVRYRVHAKCTSQQDFLGWNKDLIRFNTYIIEKYGHQISEGTRAYMFLRTGLAYSFLEKKVMGIWFIFRAVIISIIYDQSTTLIAEILSQGSSTGRIIAKCIYSINTLRARNRQRERLIYFG